ncbi:hypothetical protein NDU88_007169 [Pleurodeles waltl]|uniref:Coiled-coil domain-containing protein 86 n=1 Tax=Pleurodeles waltl TaxID=8319 RepID=A0AAV7SRR7_PLEWA|nr:hypothetical protein NDU88_007169 [Pleurodeles waltl]
MAEHPEGAGTLLRRSRRLGGRAPRDVTAEDGSVADAHSEGGDGAIRVLATVEEAADAQGGGDARGPTGETPLVSESPMPQAPSNEGGGHPAGEKRAPPETAPLPSQRPRPERKVLQDPTNIPSHKVDATVPKGKPKSGRVWKDPKKRFSVMVKDRPLHTSWDKKMKARQEMRLVKDFARQLRDDKQKAKEEKKQRRAENLKRRLENERKAEIVQVITNPAKLKRAKKKQLRRIEKRDTLALLQSRDGAHKKGASKKKPKDMEKPVGEAEPCTS